MTTYYAIKHKTDDTFWGCWPGGDYKWVPPQFANTYTALEGVEVLAVALGGVVVEGPNWNGRKHVWTAL